MHVSIFLNLSQKVTEFAKYIHAVTQSTIAYDSV